MNAVLCVAGKAAFSLLFIWNECAMFKKGRKRLEKKFQNLGGCNRVQSMLEDIPGRAVVLGLHVGCLSF